MEEDLLSIVIPCKNEKKCIADCLGGLKLQSIVDARTPVYIADAESTDGTPDIIKDQSSGLNVKIVEGGYPAIGRNIGARCCTSKYILFIDADITLGQSTTIEQSLTLAEKQDLYLVTTHIKCLDGNWKDTFLWNSHNFFARKKLLGAFSTGMFIFIRSDIFWQLGGFNEKLALGEDWDLTSKIPRKYFSICDSFIYTSNRRFVAQGYGTTILQYIMVAISKRYREMGHQEYFKVKYS